MLHRPDFDSEETDQDLHHRMNKAIEDGRIKCFNMLESDRDGDQDLNFWTREIKDIVREIMEDPVFKGNQNHSFDMDLDKAGNRLFGGEANAGVAFQIGQLRYKPVCIGTYQYVHVCTNTFHHIPRIYLYRNVCTVHTSMNM